MDLSEFIDAIKKPMVKVAQYDVAKVKNDVGPFQSVDDIEPLSRSFFKWLKNKNDSQPIGDASTENKLQRSAYSISIDYNGIIHFTRVKPKTAELYKFKSGPMDEVLTEIDKFWGLKEDYKKLGLLYNRGILLYGPPGSGKTSIINQVSEMIVSRGDVVFYSNSVSSLNEGLKAFRQVEPDRRVVVIIEDADEQIAHNEQAFLHLLDGQDSVEGVLYLATTNYLERFPPRLLRSGRFDKKIEVPQPPREGRLVYLKNKLKSSKMESDKEIERLADETEGMSFGDMLELVTAVYALKEPVKDVLDRLKKSVEIVKDPNSESSENSEKLGSTDALLDSKGIYRANKGFANMLDFSKLKGIPKKK